MTDEETKVAADATAKKEGNDKAAADAAAKKETDEKAKAAEVKKYTDIDVNNMITKEKANAIEGLLKELGIPTVADAKKNLAALKAWQDSQKTAEQKALDDAKAANEGKTAAEARAIKAELKAEALRAGVDPERLDDAVTLAELTEGADAVTKIKATLEKRPWLLASAEGPAKFGGKVKGQEVDARAKAQADINAAFGLNPKA